MKERVTFWVTLLSRNFKTQDSLYWYGEASLTKRVKNEQQLNNWKKQIKWFEPIQRTCSEEPSNWILQEKYVKWFDQRIWRTQPRRAYLVSICPCQKEYKVGWIARERKAMPPHLETSSMQCDRNRPPRMLNRGNRIIFPKRVTSHGLGESLDYKHQERRHGKKSVVSPLLS